MNGNYCLRRWKEIIVTPFCFNSVIGTTVGSIVSFPLTALLCEYGFAGGWPSVFYVFGKRSDFHPTSWCGYGCGYSSVLVMKLKENHLTMHFENELA